MPVNIIIIEISVLSMAGEKSAKLFLLLLLFRLKNQNLSCFRAEQARD